MSLASCMEEKRETILRARRKGTACALCRMKGFCCEYPDPDDDCRECQKQGTGCRYFQSAESESESEPTLVITDESPPSTEDAQSTEVELSVQVRLSFHGRLWLRHLSSRILAAGTKYPALQSAVTEAQHEEVVERLKTEWSSVGRWLLALAAADLSLFTVDSQSLFKIDGASKNAVAASSVSTALGLVSAGWFYSRYSHLQPKIFMTRARDIYGSYLFFSLSSKLPMLGMLVSSLALTIFAGRIAWYTLGPVFVVGLGVVFCIVGGLQFICRAAELVYSAATVLGAWLKYRVVVGLVHDVQDSGGVEGNSGSSAPV
ncbi:hypothetical protein C8R46DRAFT_304750 [Mycena filopes]|nr:hypothetical protein C8R46DRAFT_304750 [Mycena filopes]